MLHLINIFLIGVDIGLEVFRKMPDEVVTERRRSAGDILHERLDKVGLWKDFKAYRKKLEATGLERGRTWTPAKEHFLPLIVEREAQPDIDWNAGNVSRSRRGAGAQTEKAKSLRALRSRSTVKPAQPSGQQIPIPRYCNLLSGKFKELEKISNRKAIDWAIENVLFKDIQAESAPSSTAWLYLEMFRQDKTFLLDVLKKRVPTVTKIDQDKGFEDDGREQFNLIDKLLEEHKHENFKKIDDELSVSKPVE